MADEVTNVLIQLQLKNAAQVKAGLSGVKSDIGSLTDATEDSAKAASELGDELVKASKQSRFNVEGLRRTGGALSQLGLGAVGAPVSKAGDIAQVVKEFDNLKKIVPEAVGALKDTIGGLSKSMIAGGIAAAGLAIAIDLLHKQSEEARQAYLAEADARDRAFRLIQTGTTEEIQARIKALEQEKQIRQAAADDANRILQEGRQQIVKQFGLQALGLEEVASSVGLAAGEYEGAKDKAATANKALSETNNELDLLKQQASTGAKTTADLTAAEKAAADAAEKLKQQLFGFSQDSINVQADTNQKMRELMRSGSEQQLDDAIQSTKDQIASTKDKIASEVALAKQYENEPAIYAQISERITALQSHQKDLQGSLDQLSNSTLRAYTVSNDAAKKLIETQSAVVTTYEKYQDDIKAISEKYNEDAANLEQKRVDKLAEIQQQALDDAQKLLTDLQKREADLRTNLDRELSTQAQAAQQQQLQEQIAFQRNEVKAEQKHQDEIERIRRAAQANEYELSLSRDFAGLARSRRQTANQIAEVNRQANQERQQRLEEYRQRVSDEQAAFIAQRAQTIAKYQQDIADAQLQYRREYLLAAQNRNRALAAAQNEYQQQYAQLRINLTRQLQMRYDAARAEIALVQQTSAIRKQTFDAEYQRAVQIFNLVNGSSGGFTSSIRGRAFGGSLASGMSSYVNEPGHGGERFRTGGKSIALPGYGLFTPLQSGMVEKGSGAQNISIHAPITVNGAGQSPEKVAALIDQKLETTLRRVFVNKAG